MRYLIHLKSCCCCFQFLENVVHKILKCTGEAQEEVTRYMLECLGLLKGELSVGGGKPYFAGE